MKKLFPRRRTSFTVRDAADIGRAALRVIVPWTMPRIELSIDGAPPLEAQRMQVRLRRLHEIQERISGALLAIGVLMVGLADMVRTWNRSLDHMGFLLGLALAVGLGARILGKTLVRIRVLAELLRLRWKVGKWNRRSQAEIPGATREAEVPAPRIDRELLLAPVQTDTSRTLRGSCACGTVVFTLSSRPALMGTCHCASCRKSGASIFVIVKRGAFRLVSGADAIATFRHERHGNDRCFCSRCGTALGEVMSDEATFPVTADCFDDELGISNGFHAFISEKPPWQAICDEARRFAHHPPA